MSDLVADANERESESIGQLDPRSAGEPKHREHLVPHRHREGEPATQFVLVGQLACDGMGALGEARDGDRLPLRPRPPGKPARLRDVHPEHRARQVGRVQRRSLPDRSGEQVI